MNKHLLTTLAAGASIVAVGAPASAQAIVYHIPAGALSTTLIQFARQSRRQIVYRADETRTVRSAGVHGAMSAEAALRELLAGTGFAAHNDSSGAIAIVRDTLQAQTAAPPAAGPAPTGSTPDQAAPLAGEDVVVTGSRVTNGNNSPTPVTIVSTEQLAATTPSNVPDALNKLPVFSASSSVQTIGNASSNATGNFLNLRGFGVNRTLILFDGRRVPATAVNGTVDTNTLPQLLMQRVDVVTGGASAVYGSDAVTGVVNFILNKRFNGLNLNAQGGISSRGDDASWRVGVVGGTDVLDGRGHVEFSYEHYNSDGLPDKFMRRNGSLLYVEAGGGTAANPFHLVQNARATFGTFGGLIQSGPLADMQFAANGVLSPFVHGAATGSAGVEAGGSGVYFGNSALLASLRTDQAFGRFDYDLGSGIKAFAQASGSIAANSNNFGQTLFLFDTVSSSNAFLSPTIQAAAGAGGPSFAFSRFFPADGNVQVRSRSRTIDATVGLQGKVAGLDWDVGYTHGDSATRVVNHNNLNNARLAAALDAVSSNGQIACRVSVTNPGLYPGCVPLNPFGPTAESSAAIAYVRGDTQFVNTNRLDDFTANLHGRVFDLPAGPVVAALSGEYRIISLDVVSNAQPTDHPSCVGLPYNCTPTTPLWFLNVVANAHAKENIGEVAFEADVPLLKDLPLIHALSVNGAVRHANYSISGDATTWKVGVDWALTRSLRLRGTRSQDIRAPTLFDLFAPVNASVTGFTDIHTNSAGSVTLQSQGNRDLVPEVAQTKTIGAVYKPEWLPRFSVSVDYYDIGIANAITQVGGNDASALAQCEASNGTSPLCALYVRPLPFSDRTMANFPTLILTQGLNVARTSTHGIDGEVNYGFDLRSIAARLGGAMNLRFLVSYQPSLLTQTTPAAVVINNAGVAPTTGGGVPSVRVNAFASYTSGRFSFNLQERWRNRLKQSGDPQLVFTDPDVPAVAYTDISASYRFPVARHSVETFVSIQNLFDKQAPVYAAPGGASVPGFAYPAAVGDDIVGFYATAGIRIKL